MKVSTVVGVDGSEGARRALDAALEITKTTGTVHVVSAYHAPSAREVNQAYADVPAELASSVDMLAATRSTVEAAAQYVRDKGYNAVEHFIDDDPASAILDIAERCNADLIVVGSRGLGRASQIIRGSVSTKIAHHAQIDFMVVH